MSNFEKEDYNQHHKMKTSQELWMLSSVTLYCIIITKASSSTFHVCGNVLLCSGFDVVGSIKSQDGSFRVFSKYICHCLCLRLRICLWRCIFLVMSYYLITLGKSLIGHKCLGSLWQNHILSWPQTVSGQLNKTLCDLNLTEWFSVGSG